MKAQKKRVPCVPSSQNLCQNTVYTHLTRSMLRQMERVPNVSHYHYFKSLVAFVIFHKNKKFFCLICTLTRIVQKKRIVTTIFFIYF